MGIWPQQAWLGWCTGGTGLGGSDGQQGVGGQLDERKGRRGVGRRLLWAKGEGQWDAPGRRRPMSGVRDGWLCGEQFERQS